MTLFPKPFTVLRETGGAYGPNGRWVDGTIATLTFEGSVQPLLTNEILALDPEDREGGQVWVYCDESLQVGKKASDTDGDIVVHQGSKYRVIDLEVNDNDLIPHTRHRAVLIGRAS